MKPEQQPKKKPPRGRFQKTATGFILNGREVVVEYKNKRQTSTSEQLHPPTNV